MTSEQTGNQSTPEHTPEPITFRGRNGWATLAHHSVTEYAGTVSIALYSKRFGSMPPVMLQGDKQKVRALLLALIEKIDSAEDAFARAAEMQRRDAEEVEALR